MTDREEAFQDIGGRLDYPMLIVTANDDGHRSGCLVGFATQCAVAPPRFVVFISKNNHTFRVASEVEHLGVHVVPEDGEDLARLFGEKTGDDIDKFEQCRWEQGVAGVPLLEDCGDRFVGRVLDRFDAGDHIGFLLDPIHIDARGSSFFHFQKAMEFAPGHEA